MGIIIQELFQELFRGNDFTKIIFNDVFLKIVTLIIVGYLSFWIAKKIFPWLNTLIQKTSFPYLNIFWTERIFNKFPYLVTSLSIYFLDKQIELSSSLIDFIEQFIIIFLSIMVTLIINAIITNIINLDKIQNFPNYLGIKSVLEAIKLFLYFILLILIFSYLTKQSPLSLMSALGAATAILLLIFRDSILGLVAGIQLSANQMVRIGDWVEFPSLGVDGDIIEINLTSVKVKNWDNSISNLPAYTLIQNTFKNWQGMVLSGGRRIKRSLFVNVNSIRFLSPSEINKIAKIELLKKYLSTRNNKKEITTIELFRVYIKEYLSLHPRISDQFMLLVRQLEATSKGVPLEIYAFTNSTNFIIYEATQTEIFEHFFAKSKEFNLELFQDPSSLDINNFLKKK